MRTICLAFSALLSLCMACGSGPDHGGRTPLAEVEGHFLYMEDLEAVLPAGLSTDDSLLFADRYIHDWAEEMLLYEKARRNIPNDAEVERLVENYRKALIMHDYQQQLIMQDLSEELSEEELSTYYDRHPGLFRLERPVMKGLFLKVPLKAPQLNQVRRWYKAGTHEAAEALEKYHFQNAVKYEYFCDEWRPAADILAQIPLRVPDATAYVNRQRHVEVRDTAFCYFLNVTDFLPSGGQMPYELARPQVKEIVRNRKQVEFMEQVKADLFRQAEEKGKITYYRNGQDDSR